MYIYVFMFICIYVCKYIHIDIYKMFVESLSVVFFWYIEDWDPLYISVVRLKVRMCRLLLSCMGKLIQSCYTLRGKSECKKERGMPHLTFMVV